MGYELAKRISCWRARRLIDLYILNDPSLATQDRWNFEAHIWKCPKCACEYDEAKWVITMVLKYWKPKDHSGPRRDPASLARRPMTEKEAWENFQRRVPDFAGCELPRRFTRISWAASIAACLLIGTLLCWLSWNTQTNQDSKSSVIAKVSSTEPALAQESSVGGLESSPNGGDGPPTAVAKEENEDDSDV